MDSWCGLPIHLKQLLYCEILNCQDMAVGECWCHQPLWHHSWSQSSTEQPECARPLAHNGAPFALRDSEVPLVLAQIRRGGAATVLYVRFSRCPAHPRIFDNRGLVAFPTVYARSKGPDSTLFGPVGIEQMS